MKIIKRNGTEVPFEKEKVAVAVSKANNTVEEVRRLSDVQIHAVADAIEKIAAESKHILNVEEIQNLVEDQIMSLRAYEVARNYVKYRHERELHRKANSTDATILSLLDLCNEEIIQENSNKNPMVASVQRDYMAGEVSKDLAKRILLPQDVVRAHEEGIIHFHDADYFAQRIHNCALVNLEDMLQNGTVISETMIEPPKSFYTACNISTQVVSMVGSGQYGR